MGEKVYFYGSLPSQEIFQKRDVPLQKEERPQGVTTTRRFNVAPQEREEREGG